MSVQGQTPGPASGISYTVGVNMPSGVVVIDGVVPYENRWPDALDIDGEAMVDHIVSASVVGNRYYWDFNEPPILKDCAGNVITWHRPPTHRPAFAGGPMVVIPTNPGGGTTVSPSGVDGPIQGNPGGGATN